MLGIAPTLRFLWSRILCRVYKSSADETIHWGLPCVHACKKITYTCQRSCSPCHSSVNCGNTKITQLELKVSKVFRMLKLDTILKKKKKKKKKESQYKLSYTWVNVYILPWLWKKIKIKHRNPSFSAFPKEPCFEQRSHFQSLNKTSCSKDSTTEPATFPLNPALFTEEEEEVSWCFCFTPSQPVQLNQGDKKKKKKKKEEALHTFKLPGWKRDVWAGKHFAASNAESVLQNTSRTLAHSPFPHLTSIIS